MSVGATSETLGSQGSSTADIVYLSGQLNSSRAAALWRLSVMVAAAQLAAESRLATLMHMRYAR